MGMLEEVRIHRLVERLLADRTDGTAFGGTWDKSLTPQSMAEAYRVQDSVIRRMASPRYRAGRLAHRIDHRRCAEEAGCGASCRGASLAA